MHKRIEMSSKLKIALIGYGKMGKMIEQIAVKRGHQIVAKVNRDDDGEEWNAVSRADVAIEFSNPDSAVENIKKCFSLDVPVVVGTTGWYDHIEEIKALCASKDQSLLTATNFSIGVNLFFHINKKLAQAMENLPEYNVTVEETHHVQKLDAPSGTAITIAQGIIAELSRKSRWVLEENARAESDLRIKSFRIDDVPGTHIVKYTSEIDDIEIHHRAHSRSGFAIGAVIAAEWLSEDRKGHFTMSDLIGF